MLCVWWIRTSSENSYEITKPKFQWLHLKEKKKKEQKEKKKKSGPTTRFSRPQEAGKELNLC